MYIIFEMEKYQTSSNKLYKEKKLEKKNNVMIVMNKNIGIKVIFN